MGPLCSGKVSKPRPVTPCSYLPPPTGLQREGCCWNLLEPGQACSLLAAPLALRLTSDLLDPMPRVWVISEVHQGYAEVVVRRAPTSNPQHQDWPPFSEHPSGPPPPPILGRRGARRTGFCVSLCAPRALDRGAQGRTHASNMLRKLCQDFRVK